MIDDVLAAVLVAVFFLIVGTLWGFGMATNGHVKDCQAMQQFRTENLVFDCKERSK